MKLNKIFTLATLATTMLFATSCSDDFSYDGPGAWDADANYANLYFPTTSSVDVVDPSAEPKATIELCRRNTSGALTVPVKVVENTDDVFTVSNAEFAAGDSVATITVDYSKAGVGTAYKLRLELEGTDYVSSYSENISYTYSVTRVKWNDVGYYIDEAGNKVEGYAMYTDDFITTFYGVDNIPFPTKLQERDDVPGYFRLVNTYHENYPYNDPGDWYEDKDYYIYIDATNPKKVFIPELCETGMDWGYGNVRVYSFAGYYLSRGDAATAEDYYGTYANGAITFPIDALMINMPGYNETGLYTANGNGAFKLVIDPSKDLYTATVEDYDFSELLFAGEYASAQLGTKKTGVEIYKGNRIDEIEAANEGCYDRFEDANGGEPYLIKSPYTNGYDLMFLVNEAGKIAPLETEDYEIQPTGLTALNKDVYAAILSGKFSEKEISLDIQFQTKPDKSGEYTVFGTATETLANISWTKVGTGTYTYTFWWEGVDPGYEVYKRDDADDTYKIADWGGGVDFIFTWDKATNKVKVPLTDVGDPHPSYGTVYVSDMPTFAAVFGGSFSYDDFPCTYDPATSTFTFELKYFVSAGYFDDANIPAVETLEVTWDAAAARGPQAKHTAVKAANSWKLTKSQSTLSNRFVGGKKVQKPRHGEFKNPVAPIF